MDHDSQVAMDGCTPIAPVLVSRRLPSDENQTPPIVFDDLFNFELIYLKVRSGLGGESLSHWLGYGCKHRRSVVGRRCNVHRTQRVVHGAWMLLQAPFRYARRGLKQYRRLEA